MRKLFPTLIGVANALLVLAQPPNGAAPAGPDTAAATLVNTACAACHTLDRVNNKKADNAGWTATVTRMKGSGANLTDEQIPLVVDYLARNAGTPALTALVDNVAKGKAGGGGAAKGKGASPYPRPIEGVPPARNLQGVSFAVANMTGLIAALGPFGSRAQLTSALLERAEPALHEVYR